MFCLEGQFPAVGPRRDDLYQPVRHPATVDSVTLYHITLFVWHHASHNGVSQVALLEHH